VARVDPGDRPYATVDRYLYSVGLMQIGTGSPSPSKDADWPIKWKKLIHRLKANGHHVRT
jgi:hypothetical protein